MSATAQRGEKEEESAEGRNAANNQDVKRWGILILVYLLLGVVTTVAVAWGAIRWVDVPTTGRALRDFEDTDTRLVTGGSWCGNSFYQCIDFNQLYFRDDEVRKQYFEGNDFTNVPEIDPPSWSFYWRELQALIPTLHEEAFRPVSSVPGRVVPVPLVVTIWSIEETVGFPFPALWRAFVGYVPGKNPYISVQALGTLRDTAQWDGHEITRDWNAMPIRPIIWGFSLDVVFWASVWGALLLTSSRLIRLTRKRWRMRNGQCITCGYSLTGNTSGNCPECGAATRAGASS